MSHRRNRRPGVPRRAQTAKVPLIGLDVSRIPARLQTRSWAPLVVAALLGALFLTGLRLDVIRLRFAVAEIFEQELQLQERKRHLTVRMRQLRDPAALSRRAHALGFRRAERRIDLPDTRGWRDAPGRPFEPLPPGIELASAGAAPNGAAPGTGR